MITILLVGALFALVGLVMTVSGIALAVTLLTTLGIFFLLLGGGILFYVISRKMGAKRLKETGRLVWGVVSRVERNTSLSVNGRNPFNVFCDVGGRQYKGSTFDSGAQSWSGRQIPVYLAQDDSGKYFVDVEGIR